MATIALSITVPDDKRQEIIDALVYAYGYTDTVVDQNGDTVSNPETKNQAAKRIVIDFLKAHYRAAKIKAAESTARSSATSSADAVAFS